MPFHIHNILWCTKNLFWWNPIYLFLNFIGKEDEQKDSSIYKDALIIAVDTANCDRIDDDNYKLGKELIKIDHHINVSEYGDINYVREDYPAACCIIVDFYLTFKEKLKKEEC